LTTKAFVGIPRKMKARLVIRERSQLSEFDFFELVIWELPSPLAGSGHNFKYRLALIENGICTLRYDNEAGKGDHKHEGDAEVSYDFISLSSLLDDFRADILKWRSQNG
jgi:Family of unknown function (DUF6516)